MLLVAIVLLFIRANADLALPDYLSRIVNVGIQQGGVDHVLPSALRETTMERLLLFLSDEQATALLAQYRLVDAEAEGRVELRLLEQYPAVADEAIYVADDVPDATREQLAPALSRAWLAVSAIEQIMDDPTRATEMGMGGAQGGLSLPELPEGADVFAILAEIPAAQRAQMLSMLAERAAALGAGAITQAAILAVKAEYAGLGVDMGRMQTSYILRVGAQMLLLTLLSGVCVIAVSYIAARSSAGLARDLRRAVFEKVESFSVAEFNTFSAASLITRTTNDITQVQMVMMMLVQIVFFAPILGIGGVIRATGKGSAMWWLIAVAVGALLALIITVFSVAVPKFKRVQALVDRLNLVSREQLTGMMVIRAFNRQPFEERRFDKANLELTNVTLFINRVMVVMMPLMMLIMNGLSLAIVWVGAEQVAQATMQVGDVMAFTQYAMQIVMSFLMMSMMFIMFPRAAVSADRIADVLETELVIRDPETPQALPASFRGEVTFQEVSFRYPGADEDVLHDISFTAEPGQTTAIIGSTGSGKSTVVNLIPRFYDATAGTILVDGVDVRAVAQHDLREKIGYIPQRGVLFSGTIESNLRYSDETAPEETLRWAVEIAQAAEFVDADPEGLEAGIAQGGGNVSGGQKQRLAIARALVKRPPIYIFDDSFSALDFRTDAALRSALDAHTGDSTRLVVTQRVSTIRDAEQIIVLDEGRMVGKGTHAELMKTCETYREIALSQLSMEELA